MVQLDDPTNQPVGVRQGTVKVSNLDQVHRGRLAAGSPTIFKPIRKENDVNQTSMNYYSNC